MNSIDREMSGDIKAGMKCIGNSISLKFDEYEFYFCMNKKSKNNNCDVEFFIIFKKWIYVK